MSDLWIQTRTGRRFSVSNPRAEDVSLDDIAPALSRICRFAGQCDPFYSVAEHSVRVARRVPPSLRLAALLHDAAEAYPGDVPGPVKALPEIARGWFIVESEVARVIGEAFGVVMSPLEVRRADAEMLAIESEALYHQKRPDFPLSYHQTVDDMIDFDRDAGWSPVEAEALYLAAIAECLA